MRIATFNVNGIRAADRRGLADWLTRRAPDVIALQEVRCRLPQLPLQAFGDYCVAYDPGMIPGRNGVAVLTRSPVSAVRVLGSRAFTWAPGDQPQPAEPSMDYPLAREMQEFSDEGRYIEVDLSDVPVTIASLYLPKGDSPLAARGATVSEAVQNRYDRKIRFLRGFAKHLAYAQRFAGSRDRHYLVMGDFNIAHTRNDLKNWRTNQKSSGFLPEEREWFDSVLSPRRCVDVMRYLYPDVDGPYSWWSWRGKAFDTNAGWRIDYHLVTPALAELATTGGVDKDASYDTRISDHAPVVIDYAL